MSTSWKHGERTNNKLGHTHTCKQAYKVVSSEQQTVVKNERWHMEFLAYLLIISLHNYELNLNDLEEIYYD